jgi:hypothetical protein
MPADRLERGVSRPRHHKNLVTSPAPARASAPRSTSLGGVAVAMLALSQGALAANFRRQDASGDITTTVPRTTVITIPASTITTNIETTGVTVIGAVDGPSITVPFDFTTEITETFSAQVSTVTTDVLEIIAPTTLTLNNTVTATVNTTVTETDTVSSTVTDTVTQSGTVTVTDTVTKPGSTVTQTITVPGTGAGAQLRVWTPMMGALAVLTGAAFLL